MNSTFLLYGFMKRGRSKHSADFVLYREKCSFYLQVTNLLFSSMSNWLNNELKKKNDEAKKKVRHLDKNHMKDFKNVRNRICSRIDNIDKMRRKLRGNKQTEVRKKYSIFAFLYHWHFQYESAELEIKITDQLRDLYTDYRILENQEKMAVRRIHFEVTFFNISWA